MRKLLLSIMLGSLTCTTAIAAPTVMSVEDFVLDYKVLEPKNAEVQITGKVICVFTSACMLKQTDPGSHGSVNIKTDDLPREDRRKLLACDSHTNCNVTVIGVARNEFITRLSVHQIIW